MRDSAERTGRRRRAAFIAAAALITIYGGLLRFEALVAGYGWMGQPRWSAALEQHLVPVARELRPEVVSWKRVDVPYVGSDPINYLKFAREMRHFYQGHVREPVFLALTRGYLWLTGGLDISVSFASATAGTLAVLATCLLGAAAYSPVVGLAAGLALAIEIQAITYSIEGWRDDTYMLFVALAAWSFVLLLREPRTSTGALAGLLAGGAVLTRITALTFVAPALLWIAATSPRPMRAATLRAVAIAAMVCAAVIAPYLVNCWRETGDPLVAINYHTRYYRSAERLPLDETVTAADYLAEKVRTRPAWALDTATLGLVQVPWSNKWWGFTPWAAWLAPVLQWSAVAGAIVALWSACGRLLLVVLLTSLLPTAITWRLGGGGDWRFTAQAYPFYLVFAASAIAGTIGGARALIRRQWTPSMIRRRDVAGAAGVMAAAAALSIMPIAMPLLVEREALTARDSAMITAGDRDAAFFIGPWSEPLPAEIVTVRVAQSEFVAIRLPLPEPVDYLMTIRMDPPDMPEGGRESFVSVFVNRRMLAKVQLTRQADRMGTYRMRIPRDAARPLSRLDLVASHTVPARQAGPYFAPLPPETPVAFRLWYVRLEVAPGF
ncbi:MAG TPA: glycosyltransferase family 39 protein [Vicinamibacterales bacterium]|nr:glycosyltransferase family 39 protein [Vicinamibacterales bacterium]